jgi:PilZ domain
MSETPKKRRHPRVKAPSDLLVAWETGTQRAVSRPDTMAINGLFVLTPQPPPVRSMVRLLIDWPKGEVRARGVVRRVARIGMAVEFIAMDPEDRARLKRLLAPLLADAPGPSAI